MNNRVFLVLLFAIYGIFSAPSMASEPAIQKPIHAQNNEPNQNLILPGSLPVRRDSEINEVDLSRLLWSSLTVLMLGGGAIFAAYWLRKAREHKTWTFTGFSERGRESSKLVVVISKRLSARHAVHVIEWDGGKVLVGCGDGYMSVLAGSNNTHLPDRESVHD